VSSVAQHVTNMSRRGVEWLVGLEGGHRLQAYKCSAGVWTIGAGITRYPMWGWPALSDPDARRVGRRVLESDTLASVAEAHTLFLRVLRDYEEAVDAATRDTITQNQFDALTSFCYNVGERQFLNSTLLRYVNEGRNAGEVVTQFRRWIYADMDPDLPGLERSPGLMQRRDREVAVYLIGEYTSPYTY
jgi:lysozyme